MSLQLILGSSGSGKSHRLFTTVIEEAIRHPEKNYIVVVPEQSTMQTQRELVELHPAHGILNIDVLSFQRLAYRMFEETGIGGQTVLTETGKNLLLRKVAADKKENLQLLKSKLDKPGYLSEVKSILSELAQYEITGEQLEEMVQLSEKKPQLQYKLKDLQVLYEAFREYRREKFITAEEILDVFCQAAEHSQLLKNSVLAFDGFTGFTPVQQKALETLFGLCQEIRVTVTLDGRERLEGRLWEHELFYLSKKTIRMLLKMAENTGTEILEPVILSGKPGRFREGSGLEFLEQHLFRYGKNEPFPGECSSDIELYAADHPMEEVRMAACRISRLVREEGFRYREIAVITGDLPSYGNYVTKIFGEYEIPCFVDQTRQIFLNPCLEFIRGAFGIVDSQFSYESMFRFLRTGFSGIDSRETDRLENYVLALGIRGKSRWRKEWKEKTGRMTEEEPAVCDALRKKLMEQLGEFPESFGKSRGKVKEYADALYELLISFRIQEQLGHQEQNFRKKGELEKANEYSQIFRILIGILDEAVELLGEEMVSRKEFEDILEAGFSEARVGIIPPGIDQVHVGDLERTRLNHIRVLFFLGLNDGWIPSREGKGGIVSELEREFLLSEGIELAPTARENSYIQRFYLYLGLTKPEEKLYLSYCRSSSQGTAMRPSYLVTSVRRLFPWLQVREWKTQENRERITSGKTGLPYLADSLRELLEENDDIKYQDKMRQVKELLCHYQGEEDLGERAEALLEAAFLMLNPGGLQQRTAQSLYGEVLENSVTRLEQFASCAFSHFAEYGLHLQEREEYRVRAVDIGNIFHRTLECFSLKLERSPYNWFTVPEDVREELLEQSVDETVETYDSRIFFDSERNRYLIKRMKRILKRSVWAMHEQIRAGKFVPGGFEVSFTAVKDLGSVNIALSDTEKMHLRGRIDRVDVCEEEDRVYVKVVDYKSGNTSFDLVALYYGLQLQLVVYLNAALEMEKKLHPEKDIIPAGIFYYRLQDPLLEGDHEQTPEQIQEELLKKLRPEGLVNADPDVVERMDAAFTKNSRVIPVGRKADGTWSAASCVADTRQLELLSGFVQKKLETLGKNILEGEIQAKPFKRKKNCACDHCVYADLCGFDRKIPGTAFRQLKEFSREEIWNAYNKEKERQI